MPSASANESYVYLVLLFALFVVPRILQRWRIPTAITSFALGTLSALQFGYFVEDETIKLLATLGIVSLFLFAGLDVDFRELRENLVVLLQHVVIQIFSLLGAAWALVATLDLPVRPALLIALALLTPSTGFILDSLAGLHLPERARFWIKSKAIATELVALVVLFVALQSSSPREMGISALVMVGLVGFLPLAFRFFASVIQPHAPKSEFAFLMLVAVACGVVTHELGVYYLVGAFVVGMAAQRLRTRMPALSSERMLASVEAFSSLFVPFYFFYAGLGLRSDDFGLPALWLGTIFTCGGIAVRLLSVWVHRRIVLGESLRESMTVATPMLPTLVFTLVIAGILRDRFQMPPEIVGGLILYTLLTSLIPGLVFRQPIPELEEQMQLAAEIEKSEPVPVEPR